MGIRDAVVVRFVPDRLEWPRSHGMEARRVGEIDG